MGLLRSRPSFSPVLPTPGVAPDLQEQRRPPTRRAHESAPKGTAAFIVVPCGSLSNSNVPFSWPAGLEGVLPVLLSAILNSADRYSESGAHLLYFQQGRGLRAKCAPRLSFCRFRQITVSAADSGSGRRPPGAKNGSAAVISMFHRAN